VLSVRWLLRLIQRAWLARGVGIHRIAIVGAFPGHAAPVEALIRAPSYGYQVVAVAPWGTFDEFDADFHLYAEIILPVPESLIPFLEDAVDDDSLMGMDIMDYFLLMLEDICNWGAMPLDKANERCVEYYHDILDTDPPEEWIDYVHRSHTEFFWAIYRAYPHMRELLIDDQNHEFLFVTDYKLLNEGVDGVVLTVVYEREKNNEY
jgi:hypothetical protein